jgi:hypothetical protein
MHLAHYLGLLHRAQLTLAEALRQVADDHRDEADIFHIGHQQAERCLEQAQALEPFARRYAEEAPEEPERLHSVLFRGTRTGGLGLLRDLQDLYLMAAECDICWTVVGQAAAGARDRDLLSVVHQYETATTVQLQWLRSRMKQAAPQALVVAD